MSFLLTKRALFTTTASASAASVFYYTYSSRPPVATTKMLPAYEATFSVPLECDDCVKDISSALEKLPGATSLIHPTCNNPPNQHYLLLLTHTSTRHPLNILLHPHLHAHNNRHHAPLNHNIHHPIHRPPRHPPRLWPLQQRRSLHPRAPSYRPISNAYRKPSSWPRPSSRAVRSLLNTIIP